MRFSGDGGAVGQNFGDAVGNLRSVVAHADDRVGAKLGSMLDHQAMRVRARPLAKLAVKGNVAAQQCLQAWPMLPTMPREGTTIPRTMPRFRITR